LFIVNSNRGNAVQKIMYNAFVFSVQNFFRNIS